MNKVRSDLDERKGLKERKLKMKKLMMVLRCAAVLIAVAAQAETGGGAFRFLDGEGDALSLFGVRLGQKMAVADTCPPWHNNVTARSDQYEYCRFTPSGEVGDTRFRNYTVCLDRTNRQVVAVFASAGLKSGLGLIDGAESRLTDFLGYVFEKLGNCETRIAEEMWSSGLMEWVFFFPTAKTGFIASSHTQFGEAVCLYDTDAMVFDRIGFARFVPDTPSAAKPWWGSYCPAVELYRKHQSASNSATSLFARQLAVSEKLLKSERIAATTNKFANAQNVGCFDSVNVSRGSAYYSGAEAVYGLNGYNGSEISIDGRLYLFKSNGDAFNFGIAQLVNEPLPASVLAGKVKMLRDIPDMCFIRSEGLPSSRRRTGHAGAVLIRANAVLVCEIYGGTGDIGARLSTLLDFYGEFSNSR